MVQLVECLLAKEKVTGSSPVARSEGMLATWPSWQGKGLQNPHHEFESRRRLSVLRIAKNPDQAVRFFYSQLRDAGASFNSAII